MGRCDSKELLKSKGMKATKQRVQILEEIIVKQRVFSVNDLYKELNNDMDLVTVYRVLNLFNDKNIVREIFSNNDSKMYELSCIHNPVHPHFNCKKCGKIYCLEAIDEKNLISLKKSCPGFTIENISMQFSGICDKCSK
ncbi:transcriptional repressor [Thiospirochaeta perfilievii]|uniref:Transcriptional repressor n=1 Tax=Thiospirochaeta perfilievii TaxID=252967 RepID=A0A5C1QCW5_9SPIO|nr:Fur family transcriptional regulator [Thiospirochaeta perfilievii]QEN05257.1 transcriptional repressor [Thiospirochaeta perfilievii]